MKVRLDGLVTATLVLCAAVTTGLVLRREFLLSAGVESRRPEQKPLFIPGWRNDLVKGARLGPEAPPVQIVEFADFECPFCGSFHKILKALEHRYPKQIGLTYVHFPIPGHRFAMPAARVAECAGDQGRFEAMYDQLFDAQDQFGLKALDDYANAGAVPELAAIGGR